MSHKFLPARRAAAILPAWPSRHNGGSDRRQGVAFQPSGAAAGSYIKIERDKTVAMILT